MIAASAPPAPAVQALDVYTCPLDGMRLIEASAGTGKTWNICGIYLRLLLERRLEVQQILVVTFTKAATAELRERIRQRLADTLAFLRGLPVDLGDPFVSTLVKGLRGSKGLADTEMQNRLQLAIAAFDEAAIFTIHGFCQRALADAPFTALQPLATTLLEDDGELMTQAANDFWRRRVANDTLDPLVAAHLSLRKDSPEKFAALLKRHLAKPTAIAKWPSGIDSPPAFALVALQAAHDAARAAWPTDRAAVLAQLKGASAALHKGSYKPESIDAAAAAWDTVLQSADVLNAHTHQPDKLELLGSTKLAKATTKNQHTPTHPFFVLAQALLDIRAETLNALELTRLGMLRDLLDEGSRALRDGKRKAHVVAFDDMLFNLHDRLTSGEAPGLAASLRARFPAALIDEFQDTDPLQFAIFKRLYAEGDAAVFLVGDPKQAIYSFRNADLQTYLQARTQARAEYTLGENQRSVGPLIDALNGLFSANPKAFMLDGLSFRPVGLGAKPRKQLIDRTQPRAALHLWSLPDDPETGLPLPKRDAENAAAEAAAAEISRLLNAAAQGEVSLGDRALCAGDMAVLVRSHAEGSRMRAALAALGIGSVELSQASVFDSSDAEGLERLLSAVLEPTRERLLKAALCMEAMGGDAPFIDALGADETALLALMSRFSGYRELWLQRGVGFMLRQWLAQERVAARMLQRADGERRLTNLLHLAECLHEAAASHAAPDALLHWFQTQRRDEGASEATQLRLESDRNLVQIITIHKSKGLEYGIVFCPFLWKSPRQMPSAGLDGVAYHRDDGKAVIDFCKGFDAEFDSEDISARVKREAAAEAVRLMYVALTRAVHRCVVVTGCYSTKAGRGLSTKESTLSLLNWLVAGAGLSPEAWFALKPADVTPRSLAHAWQAWASETGAHCCAIESLPMSAGVPLGAQASAPDMLAALPAPKRLPRGWRVGSYSSLAHGSSREEAAADHDLRVDGAGGIDSGALTASHEASSSLRIGRHDAPIDETDIVHFPRGAAAGICLHSVFERIDFTDDSTWPAAISAALRRLRPSGSGPAAERSAPGTEERTSTPTPALQVRRLQGLLENVLNTPLPIGTPTPLRLSRLPLGRRLTELEFHLPSERLDALALNALLVRLGYEVPPLRFHELRGFLKGFIDLVFEHESHFFILDWKSNHLGSRPSDYGQSAMSAAMADQGYHLQSLLYAVALDRYLRLRVPGYQADTHFGGVIYLFVRGVRPASLSGDGLPTGLHFHRPTAGAIDGLSSLFDGSEETE